MATIETDRTLPQIARDINAKATVAEDALAKLFKETPDAERHNLFCALLGVLTEIAVSNLHEDEDPHSAVDHIHDVVVTHYHAVSLTTKDREERVKFCLGCDKDGDCLSQEIVKDWEEHEAVPDHQKS